MDRFPKHRVLPYGLIFPSISIIAIFLIYPFGQAIYQSFHRINPVRRQLVNVGWRNYVDMFQSSEYLNSFRNSFIFGVIVIGLGLAISLGIALLTTQRIRGAAIYQIAFIWTYAMSPIIAGVMWSLMFDPSIGLMTHVVGNLTGYWINFFNDTVAAFILVSVASIWVMLGYNITFFVAGLQNVPHELREAASIDGANTWQVFWIITFPMLSPTVVFLLFVNTIYAFFQSFGLIDVITMGGPSRATEFLIYKIYRDGFGRMQEGQAAAQSVVLFIIIAIVGAIQIYTSTRSAVYER
ncbi:MAG: sugar ABC transporter permease [Firmicutes bacterium]|nr:sugar ABC transporter permease [Bacillota bacterium]